MPDSIVVVRTYSNEIEAHIACAALEANGVPSIVLPDNAGGMLPMLQSLFPVRLAVRREHAEEAIRILQTPDTHAVDTEAAGDIRANDNDGDDENDWEDDAQADTCDDDSAGGEDENQRDPWSPPPPAR
ncbi:MAG: DUF2007 domain-containing protein [Gemmatimonadaceae bacterium]